VIFNALLPLSWRILGSSPSISALPFVWTSTTTTATTVDYYGRLARPPWRWFLNQPPLPRLAALATSFDSLLDDTSHTTFGYRFHSLDASYRSSTSSPNPDNGLTPAAGPAPVARPHARRLRPPELARWQLLLTSNLYGGRPPVILRSHATVLIDPGFGFGPPFVVDMVG